MEEKLNVEFCEMTSEEILSIEGGYVPVAKKNNGNAAENVLKNIDVAKVVFQMSGGGGMYKKMRAFGSWN